MLPFNILYILNYFLFPPTSKIESLEKKKSHDAVVQNLQETVVKHIPHTSCTISMVFWQVKQIKNSYSLLLSGIDTIP